MRSTIGIVLNAAALILCACVLIVARPARATVDCGFGAIIYAIDGRLRGAACEDVSIVHIRWSRGDASMRVRRTTDADVDRGNAATAWIREAAGRMGSALDTLGGDYRLGRITVVITAQSPLMVSGMPAYAFAFHEGSPGDCVVAVYPPTGVIDPSDDHFRRVFAHEIFHCVQFATWPERTLTDTQQRWWMEGSASYFADVSYPGASDISAAIVHAFDERSPNTSLLDMTYENYVLFAWLYESGGAERFRYFMDRMASTGGLNHRATAEAMFSPAVWLDFAERYLDRRLHYPGGAPLDSHPVLTPEYDAAAEAPIELRAQALVLGRASLRVEPGRYRFETNVTHGPYGASHEEETWADLPATLTTDCRETRVIRLAAMSAAGAGAQVRIQPRREGEAACACTEARRPHNSCLVGTWRFPGDSNFCTTFAARLSGRGATLLECNPGAGEVTFAADGTAVSTSTGTRAVVAMSSGMTMETIKSVESRAFWGTSGDELQYCDAGSVLTGSTRISGRGGATTRPETQTTALSSGSATFTCTRTTLRIVNRDAPGAFLGISPDMVLTRAP